MLEIILLLVLLGFLFYFTVEFVIVIALCLYLLATGLANGVCWLLTRKTFRNWCLSHAEKTDRSANP